MSAQPVQEHEPEEDRSDPLVILRDLPEREHDAFLAQYRDAVDAARDPAGYRQLAAMLRIWGVRARLMPRILAERPNYYAEREAAHEALRNGTARTVPIEDALAQVMGISRAEAKEYWEGKIAEARAARAQQRRGA